MRNLIKNKKGYVALNYVGNIDITENGYKTGEKRVMYSEEIAFTAHVSGARGNAVIETLGVDLDYDKTVVISKKLFDELCFDENTVFFLDKAPEYDGNGTPLYDYKIKRICDTINEVVIAVKKVRNN